MPLPEDQKASTTPFKSRDIKSLFKAASARKRKASSPITPPAERKNIKVCDKESEEDIVVLDTSSNSPTSVSDTKENKDINTINGEQAQSVVNGNVSATESEITLVEKDVGDQMSCDENSQKASSDELNSSLLNSSVNALNTSGVSENNQDLSENPKPTSDMASVKTDKVIANVKENAKKRKRMTPEEAKQRAEEREKKQQERLLKKKEVEDKKRELEEKKREREREIQQRKLQKELEKKAKEEERKEKERQRLEKKEQEEKEKQMKAEERESQKKMRQMILEHKLEMKKQKEEMRLKQEEERKKAEEEKRKAELEKEQKEREKKAQAKAAFMKFFVPKTSVPAPVVQKTSEQEVGFFKPFQVSEDMTLAPVVPQVSAERFKRDVLDSSLKSQTDLELYLQILKSSSYCDVRHRKKVRKPKISDAEVILVDKSDQPELYHKAKLLQFCENVRPPYWGTWRKKSKIIRPRNPWGEDSAVFDYEVDSDDEWDEGGPGESLSGTEQEDESEDDYEVDNEFFVPHGYLSAEEEKEEDEEGKEDAENDPEKQKALLKKKLQEFEMERKKKTTELKPLIVGCFLEGGDNCLQEIRSFLEPFACVFLCETPIPTFLTVGEIKSNSNMSSPTSASSSAKSNKKAAVPEEAMPYLIRLIHGNTHSIAFLILEFQKFWQQHCVSSCNSELQKTAAKQESDKQPTASVLVTNPDTPQASSDSVISKRQLTKIFKQIATFRKKHPIESIKKPVWWVNEDVLEKYELKDIPLPNAWTYVTQDNINKEEIDTAAVTVKSSINPSIKEFLSQ